MRLVAYMVLPNHWHLVVWPEGGKEKGKKECHAQMR